MTSSAGVQGEQGGFQPPVMSPPSGGEVYVVRLEGGHPWGIRLQGGFEYAQHIRVAQVNPTSSGYKQGIRAGDVVLDINGTSTHALELSDALYLLHANKQLILQLMRDSVSETSIPVNSESSATKSPKSATKSPATTRKATTTEQQFDNNTDTYNDTSQEFANQNVPDIMMTSQMSHAGVRGQQQQQKSNNNDGSDYSKVTRYANSAQVSWSPKVQRQGPSGDPMQVLQPGGGEGRAQPPWVPPHLNHGGQQPQQQQPQQQQPHHQQQQPHRQQQQQFQQPRQFEQQQQTQHHQHRQQDQQHWQQQQQHNRQHQMHGQQQPRQRQHEQHYQPQQQQFQQNQQMQHHQQQQQQQLRQHQQIDQNYESGGESVGRGGGALSPTASSEVSTDGGSEGAPARPSFRNLSEFSKRYGDIMPNSVATSPSRKKLIKRDPLAHLATLDPEVKNEVKNEVKVEQGHSAQSSIESNNSSMGGENTNRTVTGTNVTRTNSTVTKSRGKSETGQNGVKRSKGLEMFFNQRDKHVEEGQALCQSGEGGGDNGGDLADVTAIEKKIFPPDQKKVMFDEKDYIRERPQVTEPDTQKSSARIRLIESEESDVESVHSGRKSRRNIAVRSVRKSPFGGERDSSVDSTCSSLHSGYNTEGESTTADIPRAPVSTSQDFLESLGKSGSRNRNKAVVEDAPAEPQDPGSNLREIKVASKRSDGRSSGHMTQHKVTRVSRDKNGDTSLVETNPQSTNQNSIVPDSMTRPDWYKQTYRDIHSEDEAQYNGEDDHTNPINIKSSAVQKSIKVTSDTEVDYNDKNQNIWASAISKNPYKDQRSGSHGAADDTAGWSDSALSPSNNSSYKQQQQQKQGHIHNIKLNLKSEEKKISLGKEEKKSRQSDRLPTKMWRTEEDKKLCDDSYWLKLAGLDNKEPTTNTMILHPDGYKSDSEAMYGATGDDPIRTGGDLGLYFGDLGSPKSPRSPSSTIERKPWKPQGQRSGQQGKDLGRARALYDFTAQHSNELTFKENDIMKLLKKIDKNWFQADLKGCIGLVPSTYVQRIEPGDSRSAQQQPKQPQQQQPQQNFRQPQNKQGQGDSLKITCESSVRPSAKQSSPSFLKVDRTANQSSSSRPSANQSSPSFLKVDRQDESSYSTLDPADKNWYDGNLGSCREIYTPGGAERKYAAASLQDPILSGVETSRSASPLSSILSSNAPLSPSYDTDADLDRLIYDALIAIEDAQQNQSRDRLSHLPTVPVRPAQGASRPREPPSRPSVNQATPYKNYKSKSVPSATSNQGIRAPPDLFSIKQQSRNNAALAASSGGAGGKSSTYTAPGRASPRFESTGVKTNISAPKTASRFDTSPATRPSPTASSRFDTSSATRFSPAATSRFDTSPATRSNTAAAYIAGRSHSSPGPAGRNLKSPSGAGKLQHDRYPQTHSEKDLDEILMGCDFNAPQDPWELKPALRSPNSAARGAGYDGASYDLNTKRIAATRSGGVAGGRGNTLKFEEPWYQVLYDYTPQNDDELELRQGDLVYLLERCDDGWCVGQADRTKKLGTFPGNYVTQLR